MRPRILKTTTPEADGEHIREWKMEGVNPDPLRNEFNKSTVASFEHINNEKGYWCTKSYDIVNRISRLYKGQDGHIFTFSSVTPISKSDLKKEEKDV